MAGGVKVSTEGLHHRALVGHAKAKFSIRKKNQRAGIDPGPRFKRFFCLDNADTFIDGAPSKGEARKKQRAPT
jgi:hypothetical protein